MSCYIEVISNLDNFKESFPTSNLIVAVDFNLPNVAWNIKDDHSELNFFAPHDARVTATAEYLCVNMNRLNLKQYNVHKNCSDNTLDLIFSNLDIKINLADEFISKVDAFHPVLDFTIELLNLEHYSTENFASAQFDYIKYKFKNADLKF